MADLLFIRIAFVLILSCSAFFMRPLQLEPSIAAAAGGATGAVLVLLEARCRRIALPRLIGAVFGALTGILGAFLLSLTLGKALPANQTTIPFLQVAILVCAAYFGIAVGSAKGELLNLSAMGGLFGGEKAAESSFKILDTSVIIDGRIVDVVETGFIEGTLVIPQFVLRELQQVADSADSMKRNRGRRGLDILQRIQKMPNITVRITEEDFPQVREVDLKLIELAKVYTCTIVTNDFNLNKVAQVRGVQVLNLNELANALKPVVLPGESMRVFILKEGKEYNQGVAYLDDGTMVVVDNARRMISKTIDITVTSVLQTTAGKMIFGRFDERTIHAPQPVAERAERAAVSLTPQGPPAH